MNKHTINLSLNVSEIRIHCIDEHYNYSDSKIILCIRFRHRKALNVPKRIDEFMELIRRGFDE